MTTDSLAITPPDRQVVSISTVVQVLCAVLLALVISGLAIGLGAWAARLREPRQPFNRAARSITPLTQAAVVAQLRPPPDLSGLSNAIQAATASPAPTSPPAAAPPAPPPQPAAIQSGVQVTVDNVEQGGCLNLRASPGANATVLQCLPSGETARVVAGPSEQDGYRWWQVDRGGWLAESYLAVKPPQSVVAGAPVSPSISAPAAPSGSTQLPAIAAGASQSLARRYTGWATYYGIEDGFRFGDVMYDGTAYNPADPTMTAASFQLPLHSWLLVCSTVRCIVVQVRDRGLLDENGILLRPLAGSLRAAIRGPRRQAGRHRIHHRCRNCQPFAAAHDAVQIGIGLYRLWVRRPQNTRRLRR